MVVFAMLIFVGSFVHAAKVEPTVILASVEGDVHTFSLQDEFKVTLDSSSVGKKFSAKTMLTTGKTGKAGLLFSNGALITIKPGSRFYLRKYNQKIVPASAGSNPAEMVEEPSESELLAHLDFGELIVKAPKLKKNSKMILSSPLGTAGIRGTMFQMMAVRDPVSGNITGGVNLISGDIDFTNVSGVAVSLVSGQSIVAATSKLGDGIASETGGLVDLSSTFGPALTGGAVPPSIEALFPNTVVGGEESSDESNDEDSSSSSATVASSASLGETGGWEMIHEIASEVFFEVEQSEVSSSSFSFDTMQLAVSMDVPSPQLTSPSSPSANVVGASDSASTPDPFQGSHPMMKLLGDDSMQIEMAGDEFSSLDPWIEAIDFLNKDISETAVLVNPPDLQVPGNYVLDYEVTDLRGLTTSINRSVEVIATPPTIQVFSGKHGIAIENGEEILLYLVKRKFPAYPLTDDGSFQILSKSSSVYPSYNANYYDGRDLTSFLQVTNLESVDYTTVGHETNLNLVVNDFPLRQVNLPTGLPVTTNLSKKVRIIDNLPPIASIASGNSQSDPLQVEGVLGSTFVDPGIILLDNYYSQTEIEQFMGFTPGSSESAFGFVNTEVAGVYELIYQGISDPSGNQATAISRWVEVFDKTKPEVTIYGANPLFVDVNNSTTLFRDPGAFGFDDLDGAIEWESGKIIVSIHSYDENGTKSPTNSTIDEIVAVAKTTKSLNKTFEMVYSLTDLAGNVGTATRQIVLINSPFDLPVIVDNAPDQKEMIVDVRDPTDPNSFGFIDPGVTAYKEFGGGLKPKILSDEVQFYYYVGGVVQNQIIDTVVNYSLVQNSFVDPNGTADDSYKSILQYVVQDSFGNEATYDRIIKIVDRTAPVITLNEGPQGINYSSLQAGFSFEDPGYSATDNYDSSVSVIARLIRADDPSNDLDFSVVKDVGFTKLGKYEIQYEATDKNGNLATAKRTIEVVDTIAPQVALFTHGYLKGTSSSLQSVNPTELGNALIIDSSNQVPTEISNSLESIPGWTGSNFDSSVALTLTSDTDFYVFVKQDEIIEFVGTENDAKITHSDSYGRTRSRMSAFYLKDSNGTIFHDPGIYVRNDSDAKLTFSPSLVPVYSPTVPTRILEYKVNYSVSQTTGEANQINAARRIFIIDTEKPTVFADPDTSTTQIIVEASRESSSPDTYTDLPNSVVRLYPPTSSNPAVYSTATLNLYAVDFPDGSLLTDKIIRTIKDSSGKVLGVPFDNSDPAAVSSTIGTYIKADGELDTVYSIEYQVSDDPIDPAIPANKSEVVTRNLIVKDTKAPVIEVTELNSTFLVDFYTATQHPNVMDARSVATYMLTGLSAKDTNNYDRYFGKGQSGDDFANSPPTTHDADPDLISWVEEYDGAGSVSSVTYKSKWKVAFNPSFIPGAIYPEIKNANSGYQVTITVKDKSGNESDPVVRFLQVGDFTAPTLTLIGDYEIHDFLRFKSNSNANTAQSGNLQGQGLPSGTSGNAGLNTPFTDQPYDPTSNPEYNATGFAGGEHRMLLADYDFVDPGAYAEDLNAFFDIKDNYPDLNGNGIGEGHAMVYVYDRPDMVDCVQGAGKIHVYSWFKQVVAQVDSNLTLEYWQNLLANDTYGYSTTLADPNATLESAPAKVPSVWKSDGTGDHNFTDVSKNTKVNLDMTVITIEYRVKDGWDNFSSIESRRVYVYESTQYDGYAFYATPLTTASAQKFEDYYDTEGDNPFLTSERKDTDGDGISDFWEFALGTNYKDATDFPNMSNLDTFRTGFSDLSISDLSARLGKLDDAVSLKNVSGLADFNATSGL